jgi:hypothetical protein
VVLKHCRFLSLAPTPFLSLQDALEYGLIDEVIAPNAGKAEKAAAYWLKSGRAESDGRLEQWQEYLELQERYSMQDQFKKVSVCVWVMCTKVEVAG